MSNQIVISSGAKVRELEGVLTGTSGIVDALPINGSLGIPQLDVNGKILVSQLPNSVMEYQGTWNANTNTPTLTNGGAFNQGDVYLCNVAGTTDFGAGPISFVVSDQVIYSGSIWQKASGTSGTVTSVASSITGNAIGLTGSPITTAGTLAFAFAGTNLQYVNGAGNLTTFPTLITSIGLSMPSAFSVANSPLTANGTIAVTGAGYASQYIRGDGTLADFPSSGGGGSSVSYYLNGGTSQGTIGGVTYYEMSKTADTGTGVDFTKSGDGFIVAFLTDANDPAQLNIPAGNWNYEIYASMSANGGTPQLYAELYVYNGTTFTLISTSSNEILYDGTNLNLYSFAMTVPATTLALTDRLAIKLYATNSGGKSTTVHTQDSHLCQVMTTFSTGITALNGLTAQVQYFQVGTSGTDFNISSTTATHTFNIPDASATARGLITTGTQTIAGDKTFTGTAEFQSTGGTGLNYGASITKGNTPFSVTSSLVTFYSEATSNNIIFRDNLSKAKLVFNNSTQTFTFPAATGTLALTSDLTGYVPYTGATANVDLGTNSITLFNITSNNVLIVKNTGSVTGTNGFSSFSGNIANNGFTFAPNNSSYHRFIVPTSSNYDYTFPAITGTIAMLEGTQTFSGSKTFSANPSINTGGQSFLSIASSTGNSALIFGYVNGILKGTIDISATEFKFISAINSTYKFQTSGLGIASLIFDNTTNYSYTFPSATGTLALTSSLGSYVPYTGATGNVDLGVYNLTSKHLIANGTTGIAGTLLLVQNTSPAVTSGSTGVYSTGNNLTIMTDFAGGKIAIFSLSSLTTSRTYTLPNADGTLALTSAIPTNPVGGTGTTNYLPKFTASSTIGDSAVGDNGTTVTLNSRALSGTSATFSSTIQAGGNVTVSKAGDAQLIASTTDASGSGAYLNLTTPSHNWLIANNLANTGDLRFRYGSTALMTITNGGNVLIGTTTDYGYKTDIVHSGDGLYIRGGSTISNNALVIANSSGTTKVSIDATGAATFASSIAATTATFSGLITSTSASDILTASSSNTSYKWIYLTNTGGGIVMGINNSAGGATMTTAAYASYVFTRTATNLVFGTNDVARMTITSTGVITIANLAGTGSRTVLADASGNLSAPVSDISVKQNIKPIGYGLNEIVKMNPVWFDFIDRYKNYGEGRQNGNIAQEMEAIIPEAVFTTPSTGKMGINYDQLHAVYIKAIQQLEERIKQLENK